MRFYALFKNDELCDFLKPKYICPTQLRDMLENIILEVLCERVSKTDLIREGMEMSIKNYSTMKKPDLIKEHEKSKRWSQQKQLHHIK